MHISVAFKDIFEPGLLRELESRTRLISVQTGEVILDIGQTVRVMPLLLRGTLNISRINEEGDELLLYYVNARESCAMTFTCCMEHFPSEVKVTAESPCEFIAVPIALMDEWMNRYPTWKSFVMHTIRNRFKELLHAIDQLAFQKLDERLVLYLREKVKATGSPLLQLSHEQIANEMASSREVISRLLKRMENDKKVLLFRNQVKILDAM